MAVQSNTQELASRFASYIDELHEVFASYRLRYGSAEDLSAFTQQLGTSAALRDDLTSMVRYITLREGGTFPRAELLEILSIAIGGPQIDQAAQQYREPVHKLFEFLTNVVRMPWNIPHGEDPKTTEETEANAGDLGAQPESSFQEIPSHLPLQPIFSHPAFDRAPPRPPAVFQQQPIAPPLVNPQPATAVRPAPSPITSNPTEAISAASLPISLKYVSSNGTPFGPVKLTPRGRRVLIAVGSVFAFLVVALTVSLVLLLLPRSQPAPHESSSPPVPVQEVAPDPSPTPPPKPALGAPAAVVPLTPKRPRHASFAEQPPNYRIYSTSPAHHEASFDPDAQIVTHPIAAQPPPWNGTAQPLQNSSTTSRSPGVQLSSRSLLPESKSATSANSPSETPSPLDLGISSGVMAANLIAAPAPEYPRLAAIAHIQGKVILQAVISKEGTVVATHVLNGHLLLRHAAVQAVRQWRYRPYLLDGRPVEVSTIVTIDLHPPDE